MKILKGLLSGIAYGFIEIVFGILIYVGLFGEHTRRVIMGSLQMKYGIPFRFVSFFSGLMLALLYTILYKGIPGNGLKKGLMFGLILWFTVRFPGELYLYAWTISPMSLILLFASWLHGLIVMSLGGIVIAAIYGKSLE